MVKLQEKRIMRNLFITLFIMLSINTYSQYMLIEDTDQVKIKREILKNCLPARPEEYFHWLKNTNERITHVYNYDMPNNFYVIYKDAEINALYEGNSLVLLVPDGVNVTIKKLGHNKIFYFKDFTSVGDWIPIYLNTR